MTVLRKRKISPANFLIVFAAASFVVHIWLFYIILNQLPSWILRMSAFDVAGMISYSLAFALFESLLIAGGLALLALFLPRGMISDRFASWGSALVLVGSIWTAVAQNKYEFIYTWGFRHLLPWLALCALSIVLVWLLLLRFPRLEKLFLGLMERIQVLVAIYFAFDLIGIIIVLVRNIAG